MTHVCYVLPPTIYIPIRFLPLQSCYLECRCILHVVHYLGCFDPISNLIILTTVLWLTMVIYVIAINFEVS